MNEACSNVCLSVCLCGILLDWEFPTSAIIIRHSYIKLTELHSMNKRSRSEEKQTNLKAPQADATYDLKDGVFLITVCY